MDNQYSICQLADLQIDSCRSFEVELPNRTVAGFLVRSGKGEIFAYENSCPHTGVQLNWQPDQFLDITGHFIQCGVHGALFQIYDGRCIRGPCLGQSLRTLQLNVSDGVIWCEIS